MKQRVFRFPSTKDPVLESTLEGCDYWLRACVTDWATLAETDPVIVKRGRASSFTIQLNTGDFSYVDCQLHGRHSLRLSQFDLTDLLPEFDWGNKGPVRTPMPIGVERLGWFHPCSAGYIQWTNGARGIELVFCRTVCSLIDGIHFEPVCRYDAIRTVIHIYDESGPSLLAWLKSPRLYMVGKVCHVFVPASYVAEGLIGLSKE